MITSVPAFNPVTRPPPIAALRLLALHTPPPVGSVNVTDEPTHTASVPGIAAGSGFTVTIAVVIQLVGKV